MFIELGLSAPLSLTGTSRHRMSDLVQSLQAPYKVKHLKYRKELELCARVGPAYADDSSEGHLDTAITTAVKAQEHDPLFNYLYVN